MSEAFFFDLDEDGDGDPTLWLITGPDDPMPLPVLSRTDLHPDRRDLWDDIVRRVLEPSSPNRECGGCEGRGAHRRWCPERVGVRASRLGRWSDAAEALGDSVGPNSFEAANALWRAAAVLRERAHAAAADRQTGADES